MGFNCSLFTYPALCMNHQVNQVSYREPRWGIGCNFERGE